LKPKPAPLFFKKESLLLWPKKKTLGLFHLACALRNQRNWPFLWSRWPAVREGCRSWVIGKDRSSRWENTAQQWSPPPRNLPAPQKFSSHTSFSAHETESCSLCTWRSRFQKGLSLRSAQERSKCLQTSA
jgi:hypothetical protein